MGRMGTRATDTLISLVNNDGACLKGRDLDLVLACGEIISAGVLQQTAPALQSDNADWKASGYRYGQGAW